MISNNHILQTSDIQIICPNNFGSGSERATTAYHDQPDDLSGVLKVLKHFQTQRTNETLKYDDDFSICKIGVKYHS